MNEQTAPSYMIPPPVEHLSASLGVVTGMLKETRDFLADALNRNQKLALENANLMRERNVAQRELRELREGRTIQDEVPA